VALRNLVTVDGVAELEFLSVDVPGGCTARVNGAKLYPKNEEIALLMRARLHDHFFFCRRGRESITPPPGWN